MRTETKITIDEARALVADMSLWPRVRDFLWDFAPQVHKSWIDGLVHEASDAVMDAPRVRRFVLSALGVEPCFHMFPKDDWSRLLLLDGEKLEAIAKWLGALSFADDLRRVTDGAAVRELKASFRGVYPEVFGFTAYFTDMEGFCSLDRGACDIASQRLPEIVVSAGLSMLGSILEPLPPPLSARLKFKLPKSCQTNLVAMDVKCGKPQAVLTKLLKLKFPEAYKLCC